MAPGFELTWPPPMTPESTDDQPRLLAYRVGELEKVVVKVDNRLERMEGQITALTVLAQMEKRFEDRSAHLEKSVDANWRLTWALLVILITSILSVLTGLVKVFGS